ncbi:MAG: NTPase [Cyclobacteriaceae bacterium]
MKYISVIGYLCFFSFQSLGQNAALDGFLEGKSAVFISASSSAQPAYSWKELAENLHLSLVEAGGDPVAYYELEEAILSDAVKNAYASYFLRRLIKNIILIIRKDDGSFYLHIYPFSQDNNIVSQGSNWYSQGDNLESFGAEIVSIGDGRKSANFLVLEIPEFPPIPGLEESSAGAGFIRETPLNLDAFKLGVMLTGASGDEDLLTTFRHDLYGKPAEQIEAEQKAEREGLESVISEEYPYEVEFLTVPQSNQALIQDRVQFLLMRQEGREEDLMRIMGVSPDTETDGNRIVVKYYIRFLVRNELYIGEEWDAHPDWKQALKDFLEQIAPK